MQEIELSKAQGEHGPQNHESRDHKGLTDSSGNQECCMGMEQVLYKYDAVVNLGVLWECV